MSFLIQTDDEFVKYQLRSLLIDPSKKKELKKKLRRLGLYSNRFGFGTYRDFFFTELGHKSKTPKSRRFNSLFASPKKEPQKQKKIELPALLTQQKVSKKPGILGTSFFKKGRLAVSSCVLFMLINKIAVIPVAERLPIRFPFTFENSFDLKFVPFYIRNFFCIAENVNKVLIGNTMPYTSEIKRAIQNAYIGICCIYGPNRKVYPRNKDTRLTSFLSTKP